MAEPAIGVLLFPGVEELDFVGPWELFGLWREFGDGPRCLSIGTESGAVQARHGLRVVPEGSMADAPPLAHLLVPGGPAAATVAQDPDVQRFVAEQAATADTVLSVCTGVRVLHAAGLLDGKRVTTHHSALADVRGWPGVAAVEERYVQDGALWTAAGISAGIDMALAFIAEQAGPDVAQTVRREAEYRTRRPGREGTGATAGGG